MVEAGGDLRSQKVEAGPPKAGYHSAQLHTLWEQPGPQPLSGWGFSQFQARPWGLRNFSPGSPGSISSSWSGGEEHSAFLAESWDWHQAWGRRELLGTQTGHQSSCPELTLTPKPAGTLLKAPISLWPSSTLSHLLEGSGPDMGQNRRAPGPRIPSESIHWAPSVCRHTQRAIIRHRPCPHEAYRLPVFKSTFRSNNQS